MNVNSHSILLVRKLKPKAERQEDRDLYGARGLDFELGFGEFLVLLGKSGHGKSTLLELLLGTRPREDGKIYLVDNGVQEEVFEGRDFLKRNFGILFQDLALFPGKTVRENLALPLQTHNVPRSHWEDKMEKELKELELPREILDRKIDNLSGGQKQRVALARLRVVPRRVYLFDEPLSSIDNPLRQDILKKLLDFKQKLKMQQSAAIYVTHNQAEALSLADRIILLRRGHGVEQEGLPKDIYQRPQTRFVAEFVGDPLYNLLALEGGSTGGSLLVSGKPIVLVEDGGAARSLTIGDLKVGEQVWRGNERLFEEPKRNENRLAIGFRPESVCPVTRSSGIGPYITFNLSLGQPIYQGEEYVFYASSEDYQHNVRVQLSVEAFEFLGDTVCTRFGVRLNQTCLFYFPQKFIEHDYEDEYPGFNITHYPYPVPHKTGGSHGS